MTGVVEVVWVGPAGSTVFRKATHWADGDLELADLVPIADRTDA